MITIGINGFGRIGRLILRAQLEHSLPFRVHAINDLASIEQLAHLLAFDSVHGRLAFDVRVEGNLLHVGPHRIQVTHIPSPKDIPWGESEIIFECTGCFTSKLDAQQHIQQRNRKILISAPSKDADYTVVYGVNHRKLRKEHCIVSNASCTTNCLAPIAAIIDDSFGIKKGFMTTVHAYTGDQKLVDLPHKDLRRARAAGLSIIPTTTGAAQAVGLVLPNLKGKLHGTALRVPTANVSLVDFTFESKRPCSSAQEINDAIEKAYHTSADFRHVIDINKKPLVSTDFTHTSASSVFDTTETYIVDNTLCRVLAWYDNEWGFANRMLDTANHMHTLGY